jgi:histidinol dehydrogenase
MDLLSQAEHDEMASSVLITSSTILAKQVQKQISKDLQTLPRKDIATKAIKNNSYIIVTKNIKQSIKLANYIAFEHLEILSKNPWEVMPKINNAGAIFLGEYTPEAIGDYIAGANHTLPTNSSAKFFSPLSVDTFVKKSSIISYSKQALKQNGNYCITLAKAEGLDAHLRSVELRLKDINR